MMDILYFLPVLPFQHLYGRYAVMRELAEKMKPTNRYDRFQLIKLTNIEISKHPHSTVSRKKPHNRYLPRIVRWEDL